MPVGVPECIALSAWLNEWRHDRVARGDLVNAMEAITGQLHVDGATWQDLVGGLDRAIGPFASALPESGDPCGIAVPGVDQAVALSRGLLLVHQAGGWRTVMSEHAVPVHSLSESNRAFTAAVTTSQSALESLATTGSRETVEATLARLDVPPLPPSFPARNRAALDTAARVIAVVDGAALHSSVPSSRSGDDVRIRILRDLRRAARDLLLASVTQ